MKKAILIFSTLLFLSSCEKEDSDKIIIKNATILIDESEMDNCLYSIRTEDKESYATTELPGEFEENVFEAKIKYTLTDHRIHCGFAGSLIEIKIIDLEKI